MTNPLALPIEQDDVDNCPTLGAYLAELLMALLDEQEDFSAKRPFGNSGWEDAIDDALRAGGFRDAKELNAAITAALTGATNPNAPVDTTEVRMTIEIDGKRYGLLGAYPTSALRDPEAAAKNIAVHFAERAHSTILEALPQAVRP